MLHDVDIEASACIYTPWVKKKHVTKLLFISSPNIDRF